jgi:hypothetical protein
MRLTIFGHAFCLTHRWDIDSKQANFGDVRTCLDCPQQEVLEHDEINAGFWMPIEASDKRRSVKR